MHNKFIKLDIIDENGVSVRYINVSHIQQIYQSADAIIVLLSDKTELQIANIPFAILLDRFK